MKTPLTPAHQLVQDALNSGKALTISEIRRKRDQSTQVVQRCKLGFWAAIVILNLTIWVPLPFNLPTALRVAIAVLALVSALIAPLIWSRKHQLMVLQLETTEETPKRRKASAAAKAYIDQVREQERGYVRAEIDVLEQDKSGIAED